MILETVDGATWLAVIAGFAAMMRHVSGYARKRIEDNTVEYNFEFMYQTILAGMVAMAALNLSGMEFNLVNAAVAFLAGSGAQVTASRK